MKAKFISLVFFAMTHSAYAGNWYICNDSTRTAGYVVGLKPSSLLVQLVDKQTNIVEAMFNRCKNEGEKVYCAPSIAYLPGGSPVPVGFEVEVRLSGATPTTATLWTNSNPEFGGRKILEKEIPCQPDQK